MNQTEKTRNEVVTVNIELPAGIDPAELEGLSPEEQKELAKMYQQELSDSASGVDLQPSRVKINKDTCTFIDEFGESMKKLEGVMVHKHKCRGYWDKGGTNIPVCSSLDGKSGIETVSGERKDCSTCEYNQWGSATDEKGLPTKGKACKEMRRIYLLEEGCGLPVVLTLPPTSLKPFDKYISARITKNIPDLAAKVVLELESDKSDSGFKFAVINPKMGDRIPVKKMLEYRQVAELFRAKAAQDGITADDYVKDDNDDAEVFGFDDGPEPF